MNKWLFGALVLLTLGAAFQLGLLMYAMYVFLGVALISRFLTRAWTEGIEVSRETSRQTVEIGDKIAVVVNIHNRGRWRVTWLRAAVCG